VFLKVRSFASLRMTVRNTSRGKVRRGKIVGAGQLGRADFYLIQPPARTTSPE
jgi:hypothetical protein